MSDTYRIVRSTVTDDGFVRLSIADEPMPTPEPDQVLICLLYTSPSPRDA